MLDSDLAALCDNLGELLVIPGQVSRLRGVILDLAVSGRLLGETGPAEDATEYLSAIVECCKTGKPATKIRGVEQPPIGVDVPSGWATTMLGHISTDIRYGTSLKTSDSGDTPVLRMGNIQNQRLDFGNLKYLPFSAELEDVMLAEGDILFNRTNSAALVGKSAVFHNEQSFTFASYLIRVRLHPDVEPDFVNLWLGSSAGRGWAMRVKTDAIGQSNINGTNLGQFPLALPQRSEQARIVERAEALLSLVQDFEAQNKELDVRRRAVTKAACNSFVRDRDPLLLDNAEELIRTNADVKDLAEAVLAHALTGRLVEPASENVDSLLEQIVAEKKALGLGSDITLLEPGDSLDLPSGWRLVALGDILAHCRNGTSAKPNDVGVGYPLLRISAATSRRDGVVDLSDHKFAEMPEAQAEPYFICPGDLLACRFNGNLSYVGRVSQVPAAVPRSILHPDKLICMRAIVVSHSYLRYALNSRFVRRQIEGVATTTAGNIGINGKQLKALAVPLAPLSEQNRIAKRLDEAFALIDQLTLLLT